LGMTPQHYLLPTASGYSSWVLDRYAQYADLTGFRGQASINHVYFHGCCSPLLDALGIHYVYASSHDFPVSEAGVDLISQLSTATAKTSVEAGIQVTEWSVGTVVRRVLFAHAPSQITYPLRLREAATLHSAASVNPAAWTQATDGVQFAIFAQRHDATEKEQIFSTFIDLQSARENPEGIPVRVDLAGYVGVPFTLSFETTPGPNQDQNYDWSGWVEPVLVLKSGPPLQLIHTGPNRIYRNRNALPKAWMVDHVQQVTPGDRETVQHLLIDPYFAPESSAIVESALTEQALPHFNQTGSPAGSVDILRYKAEAIDVQVYAPSPGLLVVSDAMYPGWKAYVNGVEQPIYYTNLIMRGVYLDAGVQRIEFRFVPTFLGIGRIISGVTLGLCLLGFAVHLAWKRNRPLSPQRLENSSQVVNR
jgi:hypothetical protein